MFPPHKIREKRPHFSFPLTKYGFGNLKGKKLEEYGVFNNYPSQNTGTFLGTPLRNYGSRFSRLEHGAAELLEPFQDSGGAPKSGSSGLSEQTFSLE